MTLFSLRIVAMWLQRALCVLTDVRGDAPAVGGTAPVHIALELGRGRL